jgi:hypothetical protein
VFSLPANQKSVRKKALLFPKVAFLVSFLSILTAGCSNFTTSEDAIKQENERLTVTQPYTEPDPHISSPVAPFDVTPTANTTSLDIENVQNADFYVSMAGNNKDGRSWDTAWNELDQIKWEEVSPGATVVIAGG